MNFPWSDKEPSPSFLDILASRQAELEDIHLQAIEQVRELQEAISYASLKMGWAFALRAEQVRTSGAPIDSEAERLRRQRCAELIAEILRPASRFPWADGEGG